MHTLRRKRKRKHSRRENPSELSFFKRSAAAATFIRQRWAPQQGSCAQTSKETQKLLVLWCSRYRGVFMSHTIHPFAHCALRFLPKNKFITKQFCNMASRFAVLWKYLESFPSPLGKGELLWSHSHLYCSLVKRGPRVPVTASKQMTQQGQGLGTAFLRNRWILLLEMKPQELSICLPQNLARSSRVTGTGKRPFPRRKHTRIRPTDREGRSPGKMHFYGNLNTAVTIRR